MSGCVLAVTLLQCTRIIGYHRTPNPRGMIARFDLPSSTIPMGNAEVIAHGGDPVVIEFRRGLGASDFYSFQTGERIPRTRNPIALGPFDFDGDGVADRIDHSTGWNGTQFVLVRSGATDDVLFEDSGPELCSPRERACVLPDLDGDGRSEIAVYHPRTTRDFDFGPKVDGFIDVKSWLTIVSCDAK